MITRRRAILSYKKPQLFLIGGIDALHNVRAILKPQKTAAIAAEFHENRLRDLRSNGSGLVAPPPPRGAARDPPPLAGTERLLDIFSWPPTPGPPKG